MNIPKALEGNYYGAFYRENGETKFASIFSERYFREFKIKHEGNIIAEVSGINFSFDLIANFFIRYNLKGKKDISKEDLNLREIVSSCSENLPSLAEHIY